MSGGPEPTWPSKKRKYGGIAHLITSPESFMQNIEKSARDNAICKKITIKEFSDKFLELPESWNPGFKKPDSILLIRLTDETRTYPVLLCPPRNKDGKPKLASMDGVFQQEGLDYGSQLALIQDGSKHIWFHVFRAAATPRDAYASSFDDFKIKFEVDRSLGDGIGLPFLEDYLRAYWSLMIGEGKVSVHKDQYSAVKNTVVTDFQILAIIGAYRLVDELGADPKAWSDEQLAAASVALRVARSKNYSVTKLIGLVDSLISPQNNSCFWLHVERLIKELKGSDGRLGERCWRANYLLQGQVPPLKPSIPSSH